MLPSVKEHQSQPLVRQMMKSQSEAKRSNIQTRQSDILNRTNRWSYQIYKKQHHQNEFAPMQRLFFKKVESERKTTPFSLFLTRDGEERLQTKETVIQEDKYKHYIDFSGRKQTSQTNFERFTMTANISQRQSFVVPKIQKQKILFNDLYFSPCNGMRKILVLNHLYMNTTTVQHLYMYIYDHTTQDTSKFQEFTDALKNRQIVFNLRLKINAKQMYYFLKNGKPVYNHLDIPLSQCILIFSTYPVYKQVWNEKLSKLESRCTTIKEDAPPSKKPASQSAYVENIIETLVNQKYTIGEEELKDVPDEIECERYLNSRELKQGYKAIKYQRNFKPIIKQMFDVKSNKQNQYIHYMDDNFIIENKNAEQFETIEDQYDQELQRIEFKELEGDINQIHIDNEDNQENVNHQIEIIAQKIQPILDKFLNRKPAPEKVPEEDTEVNIQQPEVIKPKYHPLQNVKNIENSKSQIQKLHRINRELFIQNIPQLLKKTNFSRFELHHTYVLYCALQQITSQKYRFYNCDDGLDFRTYCTGIYQIFMQSEELAQEIFNKIDFNYSGFLNWEEFLDLMVVIRAKTLKEKIDLFIKISDSDGNGSLSFDEIFKLSKLCLSKYIRNSDDFLDMLCEYFTRFIFKAVNLDISEEIPLHQIKEAILSGGEDSDLLCMFCGADI